MSTIDPTSQLVAIIRSQVAGKRLERSSPPVLSALNKRKDTPDASTSLAELVSRRVNSIDPDDPHRSRKAFRVFLESVLLNEFGMSLINDPAFYRLVDEIHQTMESDEGLRSEIDKAGHLLLEEQAPTRED